MPDSKPESDSRKAVGIYDRPASADRPKTRTLALAVIAIALIVAAIYFIRGR